MTKIESEENNYAEIVGLTEELETVINSVSMKEVIFDNSLGTASHYPAMLSGEDFFDEIDFIYFTEGLIQTL